MENLIFVWNIFKAALGLGFVIFLHELGHFLLAKWNGVKVEKFSIGFGPTLASFRRGVGLRVGTGSRPPGPGDPPTWGETEYILAALPLGGYVKMLGENAEGSTDEAIPSVDPRAYNNKSVWARMQIITAGVIMNIFLGLACFTFVFSRGIIDSPAKFGGVLAGSPAYRAGLRAGDEVVAIDGRRGVGYKDLLTRVSLSGAGQKIKFGVKRTGTEAELTYEIEPLRDVSGMTPTIGVMLAHGLQIHPQVQFLAPPGVIVDPAKPGLALQGEDKVVAVGPEGGALEKVADQSDFVRKVEKLRNAPLVVEVERKKPESSEPPELIKVTVPTHLFLDFGLRMTTGPIVAIRPDSPGHKAGLKQGDRIIAVDGNADFDPMTLPDTARKLADEDKPMTLTVERSEGGTTPASIEIKVTPDASPAWVETLDSKGRLVPLDIPGLGLAITVGPKIMFVAEGSPAAKAGLKAGQTLKSMILSPAKQEGEKAKGKPITIKLDGDVPGWPLAYLWVQETPADSIELTTDQSDKPIRITPELQPGRFHPSRGLVFLPELRTSPPLGFVDALNRGWEETVENIFSIFRMFKGMFQGRIGGDAVSGVIPIAQIAYSSASAGWTTFIHFLGMLSISLAVLNSLPIPPLDGGQFTILTAEKVRGRPLPESAINFVTIAGLVFVLGLIVVINGKDLYKIVQSYF